MNIENLNLNQLIEEGVKYINIINKQIIESNKDNLNDYNQLINSLKLKKDKELKLNDLNTNPSIKDAFDYLSKNLPR